MVNMRKNEHDTLLLLANDMHYTKETIDEIQDMLKEVVKQTNRQETDIQILKDKDLKIITLATIIASIAAGMISFIIMLTLK